jgi:hypothetical protein
MKNRRRVAGLLMVGAMSAAISVAAAQPAQAAGEIVTIANFGSGMCAEPVGDYNGAPVVQRVCTGRAEQNWAKVNLGGGQQLLVNQRYFNKCLDVRDGKSADRTPIQQWACTNTPGMNWKFVQIFDRYNKVVSRIGGKCLDVRDGKNADRTPIQQWACTNTPGMNWKFVQIFDRYNKVVSRIGGKCLDVAGGSLADGATIQLYTCTAGTGNAAQIWEIR